MDDPSHATRAGRVVEDAIIAASEPLIPWPQPFIEIAGFIAAFLSAGAVGFRYAALRRASATSDDERRVLGGAARGAAVLGLLGALIAAVMLATRLPGFAARHHMTVIELMSKDPQTAAQVGFLALALLGFGLALGRRAVGWPLAAIGVLGGGLRALLFAQWVRSVNPIHELAGGLWIGTLFVLVVVGLGVVLRSPLAPERRGALAAEMVHGFSPLALCSTAVLATFGVITAWRHLHGLSNLWRTPYGIALIIKLCVVASVLALGAWNWRRQRPRLGDEAGALALRGSARVELALAAVVLAVTSILVSLPSPR